MTKLFHRLSTRIVLEILLAVAVSAAIYAGANAALSFGAITPRLPIERKRELARLLRQECPAVAGG